MCQIFFSDSLKYLGPTAPKAVRPTIFVQGVIPIIEAAFSMPARNFLSRSFCASLGADLNFRKMMSDCRMCSTPHRNLANSLTSIARPRRFRLCPQKRLVFAKKEGQMLVRTKSTASTSVIYNWLKSPAAPSK
jgi:hypothetical protein